MIGNTPLKVQIDLIVQFLLMAFDERTTWKRTQLLQHRLFNKFQDDEVIWVLNKGEGYYWTGEQKREYKGPKLGWIEPWYYTRTDRPMDGIVADDDEDE